MTSLGDSRARAILGLHLSGTFCASMTAPFIPFYIVQELGHPPWQISIYSALGILLTVGFNRSFAARLDNGHRFAPLVGLSIAGYVIALVSVLLWPSYGTLITVCVLGFSLSSSSLSTMYSFGRISAERYGFDIPSFNAWLRAMTSLGWMMGPALAFFVAGQWGPDRVFVAALAAASVWAVLWRTAMPADARSEVATKPGEDESDTNRILWLAVTACLLFSTAHVLCSSALPLFYVREAGLPGFAPGLSFTIKTAAEIVIILTTPVLLRFISPLTGLILSGGLGLSAFLVLSQVSGLAGMIVGAALEGTYYGLFAGVSLTFVQNLANGRMARANALYVNSLFIGALVAGPSVGVIAQFASFQTAILAACAPMVLALIVLVVTSRMQIPARFGSSEKQKAG
ncbi:MFS transporter [Ruegeria sp. Ofav3-42]|uniref:MFS transporter n=1 Tax=Ruegeria sp. Ofav3-42 TaxID=2917759 RepID=UPI001EF4B9EC|nr:MFS transporter [Ruegeria sp. Ofav3-42]MCG7518560.1 MFS transporter [Ruegeria sp. Ofav3-42]